MNNIGVKIINAAIYHPEFKVDNNYFIKHFQELNKNILPLFNSLGRELRYLASDNENALTMGIEASKKVLSDSNLLGSDIDLIVFTSSTPEYVAPSNALKIHHAINGKSSACVYDTNSNCVGMIVSLDQLCNSIMNNPTMKRVLLVGSRAY